MHSVGLNISIHMGRVGSPGDLLPGRVGFRVSLFDPVPALRWAYLCTVSVIKSDDCNILPLQPVYLTLPEGFPLESCYGSGTRKTRIMLLRDRQEKFDDMLNHLETVRQTDRQTVGRICHNNIALCMHCMLTRDNNVKTAGCHD